MFSDFLLAGIALPVLALASVAVAKPVGRWFTKQLQETMTEAVTDIVKPHLSKLGDQLDGLRDSNTREHAENQARLTAIEARLDEFVPTPELIERHDAIVARLDFLTQVARNQHPSEFDD